MEGLTWEETAVVWDKYMKFTVVKVVVGLGFPFLALRSDIIGASAAFLLGRVMDLSFL